MILQICRYAVICGKNYQIFWKSTHRKRERANIHRQGITLKALHFRPFYVGLTSAENKKQIHKLPIKRSVKNTARDLNLQIKPDKFILI